MKTLSRYNFKKLLNKSGFHTTAAISCDLEQFEFGNGKISVDGSIHISDCSRVIQLDFTCYNKKEKQNAIRKLDILIEGLTGAKEWIESKNFKK